MRSVLLEHVLVLSKNWVAVDTCDVKSAFTKLSTDTCKFLDHKDYTLHNDVSWAKLQPGNGDLVARTSREVYRIPEVLVLNTFVPSKKRVMQFSRRNLARRDKGICQFCGKKPEPAEVTIDHLNPRRKGGKSGWLNCVISCRPCNAKKADRTLAEAGMKLQVRPEMREAYPHDPRKWTDPFEPAWSPVFRINAKDMRDSWKQFLPQEVWTTAKAGCIIIRR